MPGETEIRRHAKSHQAGQGEDGGFERTHKKGGGGNDRGRKIGKKEKTVRSHHSDSAGLTSAEIDAMNARGETPRPANLAEEHTEEVRQSSRPVIGSGSLTREHLNQIFFFDGDFCKLAGFNKKDGSPKCTPIMDTGLSEEDNARIPEIVIQTEEEIRQDKEKLQREEAITLQKELFILGVEADSQELGDLLAKVEEQEAILKQQLADLGVESINGDLDFATSKALVKFLEQHPDLREEGVVWSKEDIQGMLGEAGVVSLVHDIEGKAKIYEGVLRSGVPVQYAEEVTGWQGVNAAEVAEALSLGIDFEKVRGNRNKLNALIRQEKRNGRRGERKDKGLAPTPPPQRKGGDVRDLAKPVELPERSEMDYEKANKKFIVDCGFLTEEELQRDKSLAGDKLRNFVFIIKRAEKVLMPDVLFSIIAQTADVEQRIEAVKKSTNDADPHHSVDGTRKTESMVEDKLAEFGDKIGLRRIHGNKYTNVKEKIGITNLVYSRCAQVFASAKENFNQAEIDECLASEKGFLISLTEKHDDLFNNLRRLAFSLDIVEPGKTLTAMKERLLPAVVAHSSLTEEQARTYLDRNDFEPINISLRDKNMRPETAGEKKDRIKKMIDYMENLKKLLPKILQNINEAKNKRSLDRVYNGDQYLKADRDFQLIGKTEVDEAKQGNLYDEVKTLFEQIEQAYTEKLASVGNEPEDEHIEQKKEEVKVTEAELLAKISTTWGEFELLNLQARKDILANFGTRETIGVFLRTAKDLQKKFRQECEATAAVLERNKQLSDSAKGQTENLSEKIQDLIDFCVSAQENLRRTASPNAPEAPRVDVSRQALVEEASDPFAKAKKMVYDPNLDVGETTPGVFRSAKTGRFFNPATQEFDIVDVDVAWRNAGHNVTDRTEAPVQVLKPEAADRDSRFRDELKDFDIYQDMIREQLKDMSVSDQHLRDEYQFFMRIRSQILEELTDEILSQSEVAKSLKASVDALTIEMSSNERLQKVLATDNKSEGGAGPELKPQSGMTEQEARESITEGDIREMLVGIYQGMGFSEKLADAMADEKNPLHVEIATKKLVEALRK